MRRTRKLVMLCLLLWVALFAVGSVGCSSDETPPTDGDVSDGDTDGDIIDGDVPDGDDDAVDGDGDQPGETVFGTPRDGKLYAAAASAIITPDAGNYPCTWYMGGTGSGRLAVGTHDDLEARVLLLAKDDQAAVLIAFDLVGWVIADVDKIWDALAPYGLGKEQILIHTTHTHAAPDTIGVYGPDFNETGRCAGYIDFLVQTAVDLVEQAKPELQAVSLYATETVIDETDAPLPNLLNDTRKPFVTNDHMVLARMDNENGDTVATLVNWHSHPEALISSDRWSADFPRWTRKAIDAELGGTTLYISGTVGGLMTNIGVTVPARSETGEPLFDGDSPQMIADDNEQKAWSLGYIVAEHALAALAQAPQIEGTLVVGAKQLLLPLENLVFTMGFEMGVLEPYDEMVESDDCGFGGCIPQPIHFIHLGTLHVVTIPGELAPEISVGRAATSFDWGGDWGVKDYPAITGYRSALPDGHLLMEFGLTAGEVGYILPESDYLPSDHPDYYEEYFTISKGTAGRIKTAVEEILGEIE